MKSTSTAVLLFLIRLAGGIPGDTVMYLPPFEVRTLDGGSKMLPFSSGPFLPANQRVTSHPSMSMSQQQMMLPQQSMMSPQQPNSMMSSAQSQPVMPTQQPTRSMHQHTRTMQAQPSMIHTSVVPPPPEEPAPERPHNRHNFTLNEIVNVLNEITENNNEEPPKNRKVEEGFLRAAEEREGYPGPPPPPPTSPYPASPAYQRPYAPPRPSYPSYPTPSTAPAPYSPPSTQQTSKTVELTDLFKPVSTRMASKVSGLIGLLLALFTGSSGDLELSGFTSIIINGIVKPLLIAKGGIKTLISKLAIPVIALLLINVEVLITIWWLWEECPSSPKEVYSKPYSSPSYPTPQYHSSNFSPY